jgi:hypothetical protein
LGGAKSYISYKDFAGAEGKRGRRKEYLICTFFEKETTEI